SRTDGLNHTTTFSDYRRGIPRKVTYQDKSWESAAVDDLGLIRSLTRPINAAGETATTSFNYDAMGRLSQLTHPSGDVVGWNPTAIDFKQIWDQEFDLQPGHWRQTVQTGAGTEVTYLDALWRPAYTERWDQADRANTERFVKHQYDSAGRTTF